MATRRLCLFATVAASSAQNFKYYRADGHTSLSRPAPGVTVKEWDGTIYGAIDPALGPPYMTSIEWESPAASGYPAAAQSWHEHDLNIMVVEGNVSVSVQGWFGVETKELSPTEMLWVRAGTPHAPLKAVSTAAKVLVFNSPWQVNLNFLCHTISCCPFPDLSRLRRPAALRRAAVGAE